MIREPNTVPIPAPGNIYNNFKLSKNQQGINLLVSTIYVTVILHKYLNLIAQKSCKQTSMHMYIC